MKYLMLLLLAIAVTILSSCKKDKQDTSKTILVKMTNSFGSFVYEYDSQNRLVSETVYRNTAPAEIYLKETYTEFNASGLPTKMSLFAVGQSITTATYEYDSKNRPLRTIYFDAAGGVSNSENYTYSGNTLDVSNRNGLTGAISSRVVYTFNTENNIVSTETYSISGTVAQRSVFKTFDNKKSIKSLIYSFAGVYSVNNNTSQEITNVSSGQVYQLSNTIEYNGDDYPTKITSRNTTLGTESIVTYEYEKR